MRCRLSSVRPAPTNAVGDRARGNLRGAQGFYDVLIVDTAGRLHVDAQMMDEIQALHAELKPVETCSSWTR